MSSSVCESPCAAARGPRNSTVRPTKDRPRSQTHLNKLQHAQNLFFVRFSCTALDSDRIQKGGLDPANGRQPTCTDCANSVAMDEDDVQLCTS